MASYGTFSEDSDIEAQPLNQSNQSEDPCGICLEDKRNRRNSSITDLQPCLHKFCKKCVKTLSRHAVYHERPVICPLCRCEARNWPKFTMQEMKSKLERFLWDNRGKVLLAFGILMLSLWAYVVYCDFAHSEKRHKGELSPKIEII